MKGCNSFMQSDNHVNHVRCFPAIPQMPFDFYRGNKVHESRKWEVGSGGGRSKYI